MARFTKQNMVKFASVAGFTKAPLLYKLQASRFNMVNQQQFKQRPCWKHLVFRDTVFACKSTVRCVRWAFHARCVYFCIPDIRRQLYAGRLQGWCPQSVGPRLACFVRRKLSTERETLETFILIMFSCAQGDCTDGAPFVFARCKDSTERRTL